MIPFSDAISPRGAGGQLIFFSSELLPEQKKCHGPGKIVSLYFQLVVLHKSLPQYSGPNPFRRIAKGPLQNFEPFHRSSALRGFQGLEARKDVQQLGSDQDLTGIIAQKENPSRSPSERAWFKTASFNCPQIPWSDPSTTHTAGPALLTGSTAPGRCRSACQSKAMLRS
jgi:hypothetical protein